MVTPSDIDMTSEDVMLSIPSTSASGATFLPDAVRFLVGAIWRKSVDPNALSVKLSLKSLSPEFKQQLLRNLETGISHIEFFELFKKKDSAGPAIRAYYERAGERTELTLPSTLREFEAVAMLTDPILWDVTEYPKSKVKGTKRVIYRRKGDGPRISVARTLVKDPDTGLEDTRETEIIVKRLDSDEWDFFAFDSEGNRALSSQFVSGSGKQIEALVPVTCLTCHYDDNARRFTRTPH